MEKMNNNLSYKSDTKRKGVLGTLEGICADCIHSTRNGRMYSDEVWQKAFNDPIVKEHFQCGGIFGQLGHPKEDQSENEEFNSIAICMPEPPVKGPDGKLRGKWDILDTPNGRILKCLCDYGYKIGISSRGNGDVVENYDGTESVEPETFEFKAFDAVLLPAVKSARLNLVTESLSAKDKQFKKALQESIDNSNDIDKAVMLKTLEDLGINYIEPSETQEGQEVSVVTDSQQPFADDVGVDLVDELQAALMEIEELKAQLFELKEKISASSIRESKYQTQIGKLQSALSESKRTDKTVEAMKQKVLSMKKQLDKTIVEQHRQEQLAETYKQKLTEAKTHCKELTESTNSSSKTIEELNNKVRELLRRQKTQETKHNHIVESLQNEIKLLKQDSTMKNSQYTTKLNESKQEIEKYKNIAKVATDKYIEVKANALGISSRDIKSRLNESYTFKQIDSVCEDLRGYNLNIAKLPFSMSSVQKVSMKENLQEQKLKNPDDVVDKSLLDLI